jgi:hypothetical protein
VLGACLVFGLGSLFFGIEKNLEFHGRWLQFAIKGAENRPPDPRSPGTLRGSLRDKNQAIEAVLARLFMDLPIHTRHADAPRINLMDVTAATWRIMSSSLLIACLLIGVVAVFRSQGATRNRSNETVKSDGVRQDIDNRAVRRMASPLGQLAILSPMQLFISPVIWSHYYLWLYLPLAYVLSEAKRGRPSGVMVYAMWVLLIPALAEEHCRAIGPQLWMSLVIYLWICWPALRSLVKRGAAQI